ncbi:MAG: alpha/beta hydrolase [Acidimicrobiales bacterium]|nr:alpha/beta hydrolase [Acidimicrobiales bacterium]
MESGTKYLAGSAFRLLNALNAKKPFAREGLASLPSFVFGLPASELPLHYVTGNAISTAYALGRGVHRTAAGKLGLAMTAGASAVLLGVHKRAADAEDIVDRALTDELGVDHAEHAAPSPMAPSRTGLPLFPSPSVRKRYVTDGHVAYDDFGRRSTLDVWRRPDLPTDGKAPVMIQVHGGGWVTGDKEGQAYPLMVHLVERGWVCVSITYRLSPRATWPDHITDVKRAIGWVKENIADHGGDPDWVAITGGSAGGHLSSLAALTPNDPQFQAGFEDVDTSVRAAVPFYGAFDWTNRDGSGRDDILEFLENRVVKATFADSPEIYEQASSMTHVGPDSVPFFILHGTNDALIPVEQARSMVDVMRKESAQPTVYAEFPGAQHAFDVFGMARARASCRGIEQFLNVVRADSGADVVV